MYIKEDRLTNKLDLGLKLRLHSYKSCTALTLSRDGRAVCGAQIPIILVFLKRLFFLAIGKLFARLNNATEY